MPHIQNQNSTTQRLAGCPWEHRHRPLQPVVVAVAWKGQMLKSVKGQVLNSLSLYCAATHERYTVLKSLKKLNDDKPEKAECCLKADGCNWELFFAMGESRGQASFL